MWVLWTVIGVLIAVELVTPIYYLVMRRLARRSSHGDHGDPAFTPPVTVIIPTFNEETTIESRLRNLREHDYPDMDVLVVDGASTDRTLEIVDAFRAKHPDFRLRVLDEGGRGGKIGGVRAAIPHVRGNLVCLTDADSLWAPNALRAAVARFADPRVGAVKGLRTLAPTKGVSQETERDYNTFYNVMRLGESELDSTPISCGPLAVYRRDLVIADKFGAEAPRADDSATAVSIRKQGYRAVAEPGAQFMEIALPSMNAYRRIRARRGSGLQHLFIKNVPTMLRPHRFGWFSVILAANFTMLVLAPVATTLLFALAPFALWVLGGAPLLAAGAVAVALALLAPRVAPGTPLTLPSSLLNTHVALMQALFMLRDRHDPVYEPIVEVRERWRDGQLG